MTISSEPFTTAQMLVDQSIALNSAVEHPYNAIVATQISELATAANAERTAFSGDGWSVTLTGAPWIRCDLSQSVKLDPSGKPLFAAYATESGINYVAFVSALAWTNLSQESLWASQEWFAVG